MTRVSALLSFSEMDYAFMEKLKDHEVLQNETSSLTVLVNHERPKVRAVSAQTTPLIYNP